MCGIVGCWGLGPAAEIRSRLEVMLSAVAHRGPDDRGVEVDEAHALGLGQARLSIIDLSAAGHQPMPNEDGSVLLVFNGEIYNFGDLRPRLEAAGHVFRSRTDSEVIVHGYEEWGDAVVEKLCGMFAFVLWDRPRRRVLMARDPMGIKPLYYTSIGAATYFASEVKAFLPLQGFTPAPRMAALRQYLEMNFVHDPERASLEGVKRLPAGHTAVSEVRRDGSWTLPSTRPFYRPPRAEACPEESRSIEERCAELESTLQKVVAQHLIADVPVGVLLSGGLDSSVIAALAAREGPVRTITMAFADSRVDERVDARRVAERIGSHHEEVLIRPEELSRDLEGASRVVDDLFGDWGVLSTAILYRKLREVGVKVVLVGEGSDEIFGGYPSYRAVGGEPADGRSFLRRAVRLYQSFSGRRWGGELRPFLGLLEELYEESGRDFFSAVRLFETRRQLPHHYNMKVDKASMSASVEARVPFLDVRVADVGYRAPRSLLLRDGTEKWLLRRVAERTGLLPEETVKRAKFGASMAASWMDESASFRSYARDVILDPSGWAAPLGVSRAMERFFDRGLSGYRFPHPLSILSIVAWRVLLLNLWSRHYLRKPEPAVTAAPWAPVPGPSGLNAAA